MPHEYLGNSLYTYKNRTVLLKRLHKGKDRGKDIVLTWINLKCDWCKRFISRTRLKYKTNDDLALCRKCAKKHTKQYYKEFFKNYRKE